jgi:hypothetical protein
MDHKRKRKSMNKKQHEELIHAIKDAGWWIAFMLFISMICGTCTAIAAVGKVEDKLHFVGETINHKDCPRR